MNQITTPTFILENDEHFLLKSCIKEMFSTDEDVFMWFDRNSFREFLESYDLVFTLKGDDVGIHILTKEVQK